MTEFSFVGELLLQDIQYSTVN